MDNSHLSTLEILSIVSAGLKEVGSTAFVFSGHGLMPSGSIKYPRGKMPAGHLLSSLSTVWIEGLVAHALCSRLRLVIVTVIALFRRFAGGVVDGDNSALSLTGFFRQLVGRGWGLTAPFPMGHIFSLLKTVHPDVVQGLTDFLTSGRSVFGRYVRTVCCRFSPSMFLPVDVVTAAFISMVVASPLRFFFRSLKWGEKTVATSMQKFLTDFFALVYPHCHNLHHIDGSVSLVSMVCYLSCLRPLFIFSFFDVLHLVHQRVALLVREGGGGFWEGYAPSVASVSSWGHCNVGFPCSCRSSARPSDPLGDAIVSPIATLVIGFPWTAPVTCCLRSLVAVRGAVGLPWSCFNLDKLDWVLGTLLPLGVPFLRPCCPRSLLRMSLLFCGACARMFLDSPELERDCHSESAFVQALWTSRCPSLSWDADFASVQCRRLSFSAHFSFLGGALVEILSPPESEVVGRPVGLVVAVVWVVPPKERSIDVTDYIMWRIGAFRDLP
ncbi:hypothetical protein Tco_0490267 [Tanacetum coccineum]